MATIGVFFPTLSDVARGTWVGVKKRHRPIRSRCHRGRIFERVMRRHHRVMPTIAEILGEPCPFNVADIPWMGE